jgi:hypothetical protein
MKENLECPACHEKGIYHRPWLYAGWPISRRCTKCNAKVRSRNTGRVSTVVQVLAGVLIVLAYTSGNSSVYLLALTGGFILLFLLPYFGEYEVIE